MKIQIAPAVAILAAAAATSAVAAVPADTSFTNANGYTIDANGTIVHFSTLVVGADGRVKAILPERARPPRGKVINVKGRTLLPGLIDAHGHVMSLGESALRLDLSATTSLKAAQNQVGAYKAAGAWILGGGWNQERWQLGRFPTAVELDAVTGARPAWLSRVDGHAGWANSRALALAGVTSTTPDPADGRIERDAQGNPTGVLVDGAMALVERVIPPPTPAEADKALAKALEIMASVGLTGAGDAGTDKPTWDRYVRFANSGRLTARIYAMAGGVANLAAIAPAGPIPWQQQDRLAMLSVKLYEDGALGSRGAWLRAPYDDAPGQRGFPFQDEATLRRNVLDATAKGFQVNVHAIGDAGNGAVLGAFAAVPEARRAALRLRDEHAQIVAAEDLPRFARLGIIASMQPTHATSDKGMAEARLGEARLAGAYAWKTLLDSGTRLAFGSDFPVEPPNPFYGLHAAVTRQSRDGLPAGGWRMAEALSLPQAFAAFTTGAAWAEHAEDKFGTLTPGKWADFIIVDRDPFATPAGDLWKIAVNETWLAGGRVYRRK